jgi:hypothetical protein
MSSTYVNHLFLMLFSTSLSYEGGSLLILSPILYIATEIKPCIPFLSWRLPFMVQKVISTSNLNTVQAFFKKNTPNRIRVWNVCSGVSPFYEGKNGPRKWNSYAQISLYPKFHVVSYRQPENAWYLSLLCGLIGIVWKSLLCLLLWQMMTLKWCRFLVDPLQFII